MVSNYFINQDITLKDYLKKRHLSDKNIYKLCSLKAITNDYEILNENSLLKQGENIYINYSLLETNDSLESVKNDNDIYDIIFENSELIAIDKKKDSLIHSDGNTSNTLINYLVCYLKEKGDDSYLRPLHRIDVQTKGVCLFSKNILSYTDFEYQMGNNLIEKTYITKVKGILNKKEEITLLIGRDRHNSKKYVVSKTGKNAITYYEPIKVINNNTLLKVKIITGRTHQIRVTMAHLGHPILGDTLYGKNENGDLQLVSKSIKFSLCENYPLQTKYLITSNISL